MKIKNLMIFSFLFALLYNINIYAQSQTDEVTKNPNQHPIYFIISCLLVIGIIYLMKTRNKK